MTDTDTYRRLPLNISLLCAVLLAAWMLLAGPDGRLAGWTGLDFHFLALPITLGCGLLLLNRLLLWAGRTSPVRRIARRSTPTGNEESVRQRLLAAAPSVVTRLPLDLGRMALALGLLFSVSLLPAAISERPGGPDLTSLNAYIESFNSLAAWGVFLLLPFVLVRAAAEARPAILDIVKFPRARLIAFGAAYALLADGGVLSVAFDVQGSNVLLGFGLALGISYGASLLRGLLSIAGGGRYLPVCRVALLVAEGAWIAALLSAVAALPSAVEPALAGRYPEDLGAYLATLRSLYPLAAALLLPFALLRAVGVFLPVVVRVFGFPTTHLVLLSIAYMMFSGSGVLTTAFEVNLTQAMAVLTQALALSYAASILRNIAGLEIPGRYGRLAAKVSGFAGSLARSAAWTLAVWVGFNHLPVASATLLDHSLTRSLGQDFLPHFGNLFDIRYTVAGLCFVAALAFNLPKAQVGDVPERYSSLLAALIFSAAGYLAWTAGSGLSSLGHGLVLGGAVAAAGMYSLALSHLAAYAANPSSRILADIVGWLAASKLRVFVLGMSVAFYGLLLRPALYEFLWLAALYEYAALLLLMLMVLMRVLNYMRVNYNATGPAMPTWTDWSHHRQALEAKPDRRAEHTAALRRRFVNRGEWKPLWAYLMELLYRSEASLDSMREACRPLRNGAVTSSVWNILRRRRSRARRTAALEESLKSVEQALASSATPLGSIHEDALWKAAAPYLERGVERDALAVALITAHCQRGDNVEQAVDRWFHLLDAPDPSPGWFSLPRLRSSAGQMDRGQRLHLVEGAISQLFADTTSRDRVTLGNPA